MSNPTVIEINNVSKKFKIHHEKSVKERIVGLARPQSRSNPDPFWALKEVNLSIASGSTIGLVGHNGSGKSTLLKLVGGILQPTSGTVLRRGRMAALLELGAGFHPDLTGRENVFLNAALLGLSKAETQARFDEIVEFSGIGSFIDSQVKFYSSGMYVRLAFAVAIHVDPDVILVDEVLAVGDEPFQKKCMDKIMQFQGEGRTIVIVSHSSAQIGQLCDRVAVLNHGNLIFDGNPAEGLKVLREGYASLSQNFGDSDIALNVPVSILSASSEVGSQEGDPTLRISVKVRVNTPTLDWGMGISVETPLGMKLFGLTTFATGQSMPDAVGEHQILIELPHFSLGTGSYQVNVGVGNSIGETFHRIESATTFDIQSVGPGTGFLDLKPQLRVES